MNIDELESRLQNLVETRFSGLFNRNKREAVIIERLTQAMRANTRREAGGSAVAPNVYTLLVNPEHVEEWKDPTLLDTLLQIVNTVGKDATLRFDTVPTLTIAGDPGVSEGGFSIVASHRLDTAAGTQEMPLDAGEQAGGDETESVPQNAYLIVEGVKVFKLRESVVNIGRRLDNTLVIDDPRVSRGHAQLRAIKGRFVLFDLNSSGGTFINGQRTTQSVLYPGDVISLAGVALIFGQDSPLRRGDLPNTAPRLPISADRTTAIIRSLPPNLRARK